MESSKTILPCSAAKVAFTAAIFLGAVSLLTLTHGQSLAETAETSVTTTVGALLAGGSDGTNRLATAEVFNSADGTFLLTTDLFPTTGSNMSEPRVGAGAIRLANGRILIAGGIGVTGKTLNTAEIYNPKNGSFTCIGGASTTPPVCNGAMAKSRDNYAMVKLLSGQILMIGGHCNCDQIRPDAELYNPRKGRFTLTTDAFAHGTNLVVPRKMATATLLTSGRVLVAGGITFGDVVLGNAEIYKPAVGQFALTTTVFRRTGTDMTSPRVLHTATLLRNGKVLLAGGRDNNGNILQSTEIFNPQSGSFTPGASMTSPRAGHVAVPLKNGTLLLAGGTDQSGPVATAEIYDPATGTFTSTIDAFPGTGTNMQVPRYGASVNQLSTGQILIAGGVDGSGNPLNTAELFDQTTGSFSLTTTAFAAGSNMTTSRTCHASASTHQAKTASQNFCE